MKSGRMQMNDPNACKRVSKYLWADDLKQLGYFAKGLSRNPLGIIALFIVLVYGFAALVTTFSGSLSWSERLPLIWFLVLFPVLVLAVFSWLVSRHGGKLYAPSDYRNEENYIRMQLRHLETKVGIVGAASPLSIEQHRAAITLDAPHSDARLAIAQMRLDVEKELFLLSRFTPGISGELSAWPLRRHIEELEKAGAIEPDLAGNLREFVAIANRLVHDTSFVEEDARNAASVGSALVAKLHHRRLIAALSREMDGNLLWHLHRRKAGNKYYFWSAVAASVPEFGYNFDVYQEAAHRHVERLRANHPQEAEVFYILSLDEFVAVLEFRERELQRIMKNWSSANWKDSRAIEWQWPSEWGDVDWNGPILREKVHLWGAEEDLMLTRGALDSYRPRLLAQRKPQGAAAQGSATYASPKRERAPSMD
jgi:hypothetical protein